MDRHRSFTGRAVVYIDAHEHARRGEVEFCRLCFGVCEHKVEGPKLALRHSDTPFAGGPLDHACGILFRQRASSWKMGIVERDPQWRPCITAALYVDVTGLIVAYAKHACGFIKDITFLQQVFPPT